MATKTHNAQLEHAVLLIHRHLPEAVADNWRVLGTAAVMACLVLCPLLAWAAESYRSYLAVGPGGMPHNLLGWMLQGAAQLVARRDTRDHRAFSDPRLRKALGEHGTKSFLTGGGGLPARKGDRPVVPGFVAPQRQVSGRGPRNAEMRARLIAHHEAIARANPSLVYADVSRLEGPAGSPGGHAALWFAVGWDRACPAYLRKTKGEFAHVHPEASMHVTLSLADAEEVVRQGWGERHPLSGVRGFWPITYVMLYAPRDEAELAVCKRVVDASVRFVCYGGPEVAGV